MAEYAPPAVSQTNYNQERTQLTSVQGPPPPKVPEGWKAVWNGTARLLFQGRFLMLSNNQRNTASTSTSTSTPNSHNGKSRPSPHPNLQPSKETYQAILLMRAAVEMVRYSKA